MNPLTSVKGSIVTAFVLAAIVSIWLTILGGAEIGAAAAGAPRLTAGGWRVNLPPAFAF